MHLETMVTAIGLSHSWLQLVICMPFGQSKTILRAELILIPTMKIEYYNKVSVSFIFLLNEKKKKKKEKRRRNYHVAIDSTFDYDCLR